MKNKRPLTLLIWAATILSIVLSGCGNSANGTSSSVVETSSQTEEVSSLAREFEITLGFAGDICFADDEAVMEHYRDLGSDISKCIDPAYIKIMNSMDIMWINNEFCYSDRGAPMAGKMWTFRSKPENVSILKTLGVDIVGLANNHVFDYGEDAFLDTLDTLRNAGIPYVGAGKDLAEAAAPVYKEVAGVRIAYVAASRAEKYILTPGAGENSPGVLRCYDPERFIESIKEAAANADYVIAIPHWGTERSTVLEKAQKETAHEYIDAGADIVIGGHSHCLQGAEFYNNKPILYSLGNFWFDEFKEDTMIAKVTLRGTSAEDIKTEVSIIPGTHENMETTMASTESEKERIYKYMEKISINATVNKDGTVQED